MKITLNLKTKNNMEYSKEVQYEHFVFSGGEEHIRFSQNDFLTKKDSIETIEIKAKLTSSSEIIKLTLIVDAIKRLSNAPIQLSIPYFPYARQDRVCVSGEAFGAKVMANIINSLNFEKVTVYDAHSDVVGALVDNVENIEQLELIPFNLIKKIEKEELLLVAPDAGATKKTFKIAEFANASNIIQAIKKRDLKTGQIVKTEILGNVDSENILIVDDICDGGRTFIELAKVLKANNANKISLFVTHGIFSKGFEVFKGYIDTIYTTDSFHSAEDLKSMAEKDSFPNLKVVKV